MYLRIAANPALSIVNRPWPSIRSWWSTISIVTDRLWGSAPRMTCSLSLLPPEREPMDGELGSATTSWGRPLSHALSTTPAGQQTDSEPHPKDGMGSPKESVPPGTWTRVWPDTGPAKSL